MECPMTEPTSVTWLPKISSRIAFTTWLVKKNSKLWPASFTWLVKSNPSTKINIYDLISQRTMQRQKHHSQYDQCLWTTLIKYNLKLWLVSGSLGRNSKRPETGTSKQVKLNLYSIPYLALYSHICSSVVFQTECKGESELSTSINTSVS